MAYTYTVTHPDITEEEREKRMKVLKEATANLMRAYYQAHDAKKVEKNAENS